MPLFLEQEGEKEGLGLRAGRPKDQKPDRSQAVRPKPHRQDRLTGSTGLYTIHSIIFTEISFYPETSILSQIVQIIHMTHRNIPEFER